MNTNNLLDHLVSLLDGKRNDAALSRKLGIATPVISKLRHDKLKVGATLIITIHEVFGIDIAAIKAMAGLPAYVGGV